MENTHGDFAQAIQYSLGMGNTACSLTHFHEFKTL